MTHNPPKKKYGYMLEAHICLTPDLAGYHTHATIQIEAATATRIRDEVMQKAHEDFQVLVSRLMRIAFELPFEDFEKSLAKLNCFEILDEETVDLNESPLTHTNPGGIQ